VAQPHPAKKAAGTDGFDQRSRKCSFRISKVAICPTFMAHARARFGCIPFFLSERSFEFDDICFRTVLIIGRKCAAFFQNTFRSRTDNSRKALSYYMCADCEQ